MLSHKVKVIYEAAGKNQEFLNDIKKADNDNPPSIFDSDSVRLSFAMVYYGWLVGKYGTNWEKYI